MRVIFVTQVVDADDPILGATVAKLRALASRCDQLVVVTGRVGTHDLPDNCTLRTFGASTRFRRGVRYARAVVPELISRRRPAALVAHMCPIYLVLAAPFAKLVRVPLALWYTHWMLDRTLRLATALADVGLSVDRRSYPLDRSKILGIGHGIDVAQFAARRHAPAADGILTLLALGRTSPAKGFPTLIRACERIRDAGIDIRVDIRGASSTAEERTHRRDLELLIEERGLQQLVAVRDPIPRPQVPDLIRRYDAVVNATRGETTGGALDKVVFETAACAVPIFACNPYFDTLLDGLPLNLRFASDDDADLARVLSEFSEADTSRREATGHELRRRVEASHSVDSWAQAVVTAVQRVKA